MNSQLVFLRLYDSRWPTDHHIWSKPILGHNLVLDWDIDFKFCVLAPQNKMPWFFCQGRPNQDGRQAAIYGQNLFWAITRYWNEILTSNFVCWHLKIKTYDFFLSRSSDSRWPTDCHIWSKPILGHNLVLDWDIDFRIGMWVGFVNPLQCVEWNSRKSQKYQ